MQLIVVGDIHTQAEKLWRILQEAELADEQLLPTETLRRSDTKLILLGDLVHAKNRPQYSKIANVGRYDEYNPKHVSKVETAQEAFLHDVKRFQERVPEGNMTILMGNHDYNAITQEQGALRTDDIVHLEWKEGRALDPELQLWMESWPYELELEGIHLAHVGPLKEHNTYDSNFYLENRRRWIYEEKDYLADTPYRLGIYGHTPVRGGVNIASQGRAILLDTNGQGEEYCFLTADVRKDQYRIRMQGCFFDELMQR